MGTCTKQTSVLGGPFWPQQREDWQVAQEELVLVIAHRPPTRACLPVPPILCFMWFQESFQAFSGVGGRVLLAPFCR